MNALTETESLSQLIVDFDDNRLVLSLFGPHDQNLTRLEQVLDVTILSRGNRIVVRGDARDCQTARSTLTSLYDRLERGEVVDMGDVDGAVRMAKAEANRMAPTSTQQVKPQHTGRKSGRNGHKPFKKARAHKAQLRADTMASEPPGVAIRTRTRSIVPRTPRQADYMTGMAMADLVFGIGPAGTGKTYLAVAMAVSKMMAGEIDRIILSRPAVEAGENLGFLPGDLKDKVDPYLRPLYDALYDMMPKELAERRIANGDIEVAPLAYMRGRTLKNAFVILDEAQNTTPVQMKMFLTRFGENARMVICGDPSQVDLPRNQQSGLVHAMGILTGVPGISIIRFGEDDVVRHPLVGRIVKAYDKSEG